MAEPKIPATYLIVDNTAEKFYVGSTTNLRGRMGDHSRQLKKGNHGNPGLQKAFNEGHDLHAVVVMAGPDHPKEITKVEQFLLDGLYPLGVLYNNGPHAVAPFKGVNHKPEAIEKCRLINLGRKHTPEHIEKNRAAQTGKPMHPNTRAKILEAITGRAKSPEEIEKIRIANIGRVMTDEDKRKMSEAAQRRSPEQVAAKVKAMNAAVSTPIRVDGVVYPSATAAAKEHGIDKGTAMDRARHPTKFNNWEVVKNDGS